MPYIKVDILIYKDLGYPSHREHLIVGRHKGSTIKKAPVIELFKRMVNVFRYYNHLMKEEESNDTPIYP